MKKTIVLAAVAASIAGGAYAGAVEPVAVVEAMVAAEPAPQATDWSGFYGGIAGASVAADADFFYDGDHDNGPWDSEGTAYGGFAGYNFQSGNLVYGAELSFMAGDIAPVEGEWYTYDNILDVKARAGYAMGSTLVYGAVGYSSVDFSESYAAPASDPLTGFGYGVGADLMVTNKVFVGLEYFTRAVEGPLTYPGVSGWTVEGNVATITARIGMHF